MTDPVTTPDTQPVEPASVPRKNFVRRFFSALGPGLVTGAAILRRMQESRSIDGDLMHTTICSRTPTEVSIDRSMG